MADDREACAGSVGMLDDDEKNELEQKRLDKALTAKHDTEAEERARLVRLFRFVFVSVII